MKTRVNFLIGLAFIFLFGFLLIFAVWYAGKFLPHGITTRIPLQAEDAAMNISGNPAISYDGRFIAYGDRPRDGSHISGRIFVLDRLSGRSVDVSETLGGFTGRGGLFDPAISANGCEVAFVSSSAIIVPEDRGERVGVFVYDCRTGEIAPVSVASDGTQGDDQSTAPAISADGRYVVFESFASNLVDGDTNGVADIFVRDMLQGETTRVSVASNGSQANGPSRSPGISADGRYIVFLSTATDLVAQRPPNTVGLFVHDLIAGETSWVAEVYRDPGGGEGEPGGFDPPSITADGRKIVYSAFVWQQTAEGRHGWPEGFIHDRQTGKTVSLAEAAGVLDDTPTKPFFSWPIISANGRWVVASSGDRYLVPEDTNGWADVFIVDLKTKRIQRVSVATDGTQGNERSFPLAISGNGRHVLFKSVARSLVPWDTNGLPDIFIHDLLDFQPYLIPFMLRTAAIPDAPQPYPPPEFPTDTPLAPDPYP